jgi:ribosomal protein L29
MATQKVNALADFRSMSTADLVTKIADSRRELVEQHRANKAGELPSAAVIAKTRKEIAKAMTVLAEKSREVEAAEPKEQEK